MPCIVELYLYSPQYLYSKAIPLLPSVPVQYSYTSTPLSACTVQLYLYSPQCLYSTAIPLLPSVPVQYSYTSTPLSTCTVQLYLYSPQYLYSTAIPLLPLWAVSPVHSLRACTRVHFTLPLLLSWAPRGTNPNTSIAQRGCHWKKRQQASGRLGPKTLESRERVLTYSSQQQIRSITQGYQIYSVQRNSTVSSRLRSYI